MNKTFIDAMDECHRLLMGAVESGKDTLPDIDQFPKTYQELLKFTLALATSHAALVGAVIALQGAVIECTPVEQPAQLAKVPGDKSN